MDFETKLYRFLVYGSCSNIYYPGFRLAKCYYQSENLEKLREVLASLEKDVVLKMIKSVHEKELSPHPELIPLIITECCRITAWKSDAIKLAESLLKNGDEFLLFFKFAFEVLPKLGTGRSIKRFIWNWYNRQNFKSLAIMIAEQPKYRGWSHADLIKLGHVKSSDISKSAIYAYAIGGVSKMVSLCGDNDDARYIVNLLLAYDAIKKEVDPERAVEAIKAYMASLPLIHHTLLKNRDVWSALLPRMELDEIMPKLHILSKYGLLGAPQENIFHIPLDQILFNRIVNKTNISKSKINPSTIILEMYRYMNEPLLKQLTAQKNKQKIQQTATVYPEYLLALEQSTGMAFENIPQINLNFTIIVDNFKLLNKQCAHRRFLSVAVAASILILMLNRAAAGAKIITFELKNPKLLEGKVLDSVESLANLLSKDANKTSITKTIADFMNPWNVTHVGTDVYVVLANTVRVEQYEEMLWQHRQYNARNPNLCGVKNAGAIKEDKSVIFTSGFSDKLFSVISSLCKNPVPDDERPQTF